MPHRRRLIAITPECQGRRLVSWRRYDCGEVHVMFTAIEAWGHFETDDEGEAGANLAPMMADGPGFTVLEMPTALGIAGPHDTEDMWWCRADEAAEASELEVGEMIRRAGQIGEAN